LFHLPLRNWLGNADQLSIENSHGRDRSSRHEGEENHQAGIRIASAIAADALGNWSLVVEPLGVSLDKTDDEAPAPWKIADWLAERNYRYRVNS
jgi:hypothetical protein